MPGCDQPGDRRHPARGLPSDSLRIQPRGRAAPGGVRHRSARARRRRSARRSRVRAGRVARSVRSSWERRRALRRARLRSTSPKSPPFPTRSPSEPSDAPDPAARARSRRRRRAGPTPRGSAGAEPRRISRALKPMERSGRRFRRWLDCITRLRVSEFGDPDHRFGFSVRRARRKRARSPSGSRPRHRGRPDYPVPQVLPSRRMRKRRDGTGRHRRSRASGGQRARSRRASSITLRELERRVERLEERADRRRAMDRALRRMGVLPLLGPGHRVRRSRAAGTAMPSASEAELSATARPSPWTSANGMTPTTSSSPSSAVTGPSCEGNAGTSPARESTGSVPRASLRCARRSRRSPRGSSLRTWAHWRRMSKTCSSPRKSSNTSISACSRSG